MFTRFWDRWTKADRKQRRIDALFGDPRNPDVTGWPEWVVNTVVVDEWHNLTQEQRDEVLEVAALCETNLDPHLTWFSTTEKICLPGEDRPTWINKEQP